MCGCVRERVERISVFSPPTLHYKEVGLFIFDVFVQYLLRCHADGWLREEKEAE